MNRKAPGDPLAVTKLQTPAPEASKPAASQILASPA
jgi:hypothetical protein